MMLGPFWNHRKIPEETQTDDCSYITFLTNNYYYILCISKRRPTHICKSSMRKKKNKTKTEAIDIYSRRHVQHITIYFNIMNGLTKPITTWRLSV